MRIPCQRSQLSEIDMTTEIRLSDGRVSETLPYDARYYLHPLPSFIAAAMLLYLKSDPDLWRKGCPDFRNMDALAGTKRCAELEVGLHHEK